MDAALVGRERVDLVDDHGPGRSQHLPAGFGAEQDVERFGRGHDDVRRALAHAQALAGRRVAGAHPGPDLDVRQTLGLQRVADAGERGFQIALDVVRERLQRRDVDDLGLVLEPAVKPLPEQVVDRGEEGRERLARARGGRDQRVPAGPDRRPGLDLRRGRRREVAVEPRGDRRMEQGRLQRAGPIVMDAVQDSTGGDLLNEINAAPALPAADAPTATGAWPRVRSWCRRAPSRPGSLPSRYQPASGTRPGRSRESAPP